MKRYKYLWVALAVMIFITPLGLLAAGTAWGEWGTEEVGEMLGYIPEGMEELSESWTIAPMTDYSVSLLNGSFVGEAAGYILSAVAGVLLVIGIIHFIGKMVPAEQEGLNE
jgi:hypothetical protein